MALPLSSNPLNVAPRTLTGPNSSHSLKAAESAARCPHTGKGAARLLEASRSLSGVISALYRLGKNRSGPNGKHHKLEAMESITNCHRKKAPQTSSHGEHHTAAHGKHLPGQHGKHLPGQHGEHQKLAATVSVIQHRVGLASQTSKHGRRCKPHGRVGDANPGAINSLFFTASRCNQFFIVNNGKTQSIQNNNQPKVQSILYSLHLQSVIDSLLLTTKSMINSLFFTSKMQLINNKNKQLKSNNNKQ